MNGGEFPIDAVVTWIDGDDPAHRAKRESYMHGREMRHDDVGGETRYRQMGEVAFCIASIMRFAPFVRRIFIVTDNQNPNLDRFLEENFPDRRIPVETVDHKVIFKGWEQYLPLFNSRAIETMLWRIPGLSEHYIYLNDDFMFTSPASATDFFDADGSPVCYADRMAAWKVDLLLRLTPRRNGHKHYGFKNSLLNGARAAGMRKFFFYLGHAPLALRRSVFEEYYGAHPELIERNIRHRFRNEEQYNPQSMFYSLMYMRGECRVVPLRGLAVCMKPNGSDSYFRRKIEAACRPGVKFFCVNSLDKATDEQKALYRRRMMELLGVKETE